MVDYHQNSSGEVPAEASDGRRCHRRVLEQPRPRGGWVHDRPTAMDILFFSVPGTGEQIWFLVDPST